MNQTSFYRAFEDRFRGSRDLIKDRLRTYARFTDPLLQLPGSRTVLDLGCGRGEWLELLGESGFDAQGVDLDEGMLAACRERGLNARHGDALAALRAQPDDSLAMVSCFHLVEHLPFDLVRDLIAEALRVLQPGGLLIMETPNPENLTVGATSFYLDPSHLHPLPPGLLGFAAEYAGFARQRIVRLQEDPALHTAERVPLISVLEGVSPDYAVVAQKAAPPDLQAPFDAAFGGSWGLTLGELAHRYEEQAAGRHAELHHIIGGIQRRAEQIAIDVTTVHAQAQAHLAAHIDELRQQAARQEARLAHVEAHAAEMSQRVVDMLDSTSWRITEPLRRVSAVVIRLRKARAEGRLGSAAKARAVRLARRLCGAVLRRPALKRAARAVLRRVPKLEARLYAMMLDNSGATRVVLDDASGELSPRATRAYQQLRQLKQEQARKPDAHSH
ncbi:bifunctional 2-polyprenyl-6-hydroxyphenol methylase/3-demethylubiquinol 3-O-methyltransferase UbiG [Massilia sp. BSC265]|uniref:class I SAM-dependent methyltransferase n=1 Tax=Massilia sp. BSC265 TaxID=1549812 RepID=UPI00068C125F|nr:class I SAM-dependent methyltransferase [Massilia sp. BSC265]